MPIEKLMASGCDETETIYYKPGFRVNTSHLPYGTLKMWFIQGVGGHVGAPVSMLSINSPLEWSTTVDKATIGEIAVVEKT